MASLVTIFGILIALVVIIFFVLWHRLSEDKEEPMDYTIVRMYFPEVCKYAEGLLLDFKNGSQRKGIVLMPKDVDYMRKLKKKEKVEINPILVWANDYQLKFYPRGTLSPDRNIIDLYPPVPEGLPEFMKETPQGISIMEYVAEKKAEKTSVDVIRMERDTEDRMLKLTKGKDLFNDYLKKEKALGKDFMKKYIEREGKDTDFKSGRG